ncbi:hypothetical protein DEJ50_31995 [Streptomyces venezuelae]|uniref:Lipoprotein n=1 Tax=Streptomyces venezuelae TaxID=54571 RepID=A0A5P2DB76_STRVZ|nr:hypothetical protein [Streptomyces venezuelae]QES51790.1 hypothetical protein DEJ50_31995 [Streptomyces venezuelae]
MAGALAAALLYGACSAGPTIPTGTAHPAVGPAGPGPLDGMAEAIGCTPALSVDADELRQGECRTGQGTSYRMLSFARPEGRDAWLTEARAYGGSYLVGERWVVTAHPDSALPGLRERLGGTIESGTAHGSNSPSGPAGPDGPHGPHGHGPPGAPLSSTPSPPAG